MWIGIGILCHMHMLKGAAIVKLSINSKETKQTNWVFWYELSATSNKLRLCQNYNMQLIAKIVMFYCFLKMAWLLFKLRRLEYFPFRLNFYGDTCKHDLIIMCLYRIHDRIIRSLYNSLNCKFNASEYKINLYTKLSLHSDKVVRDVIFGISH